MRPIGGWLFGTVADRYGRRTSMMPSVLMMCFGSLMIAVLPTYASIVIVAPVLLVVAGLIQGLSVGGEYGTSATYMSEVASPRHRGFFASFQYVTLIGGQLLALLVLVVLQAVLTPEDIRAWGWRIPFLIGAGAAIVALFLRRALHETTTAAGRSKSGAGTISLLLEHPKPLMQVILLTSGGSLAFYTDTTHMQKFLVSTAGFSAERASVTMTAVLVCYMLLQPAIGALSDRVGRRACLIVFGLGGAIMTVPLLSLLAGVVKAELFPAEIRALGVGLGYAIASSLVGGTAEYVALLFKSRGMESTFFWYVSGFCILSLLAALSMHDTRVHGDLAREEGAGGRP